MHKKNVIYNLIVSFLTQIITLGLGLIIPRLILLTWGSEYNGLISSVTNIMRYLALLEAGFNTATIQALYKTLGENDNEQTSVVVRTSQHYYHKISVAYGALVIVVALLYPLLVKTSISFFEVFLIITLQGMTGVINFAFRASYQQLLNAQGKYYVISLITLLTTILTYIAKIISVTVFHNVLIMQAMSVIVMIVQVTVYSIYFKKNYGWINKNAVIDKKILKNRQYYLIQQMAGLVFNSTDTFVLSVFCGLKVASVYAVYNLVYSALASMISLVRGSTNFVLGQSFYKGKSIFEKIYDTYTGMQTALGSILSSTCIVLILGFIKLYTKGVTDIDYIDFVAAFLFSFNLILECSRGASLASANIAGKAPQTTWRYVLEASINLSVSLILVQFIGLRGVLIGTSIAGIYRTTDSILYTNRYVLNRSAFREFSLVILHFSIFIIIAGLSRTMFIIDTDSYLGLILYAIIVMIVITGIYGVLFYFANKNSVKYFVSILKKRDL